MVRTARCQVGNRESGQNPEQPSLLCLIQNILKNFCIISQITPHVLFWSKLSWTRRKHSRIQIILYLYSVVLSLYEEGTFLLRRFAEKEFLKLVSIV